MAGFEYFSRSQKFIGNMVKISTLLKNFKPEERKEKLRKYIAILNKFLNDFKPKN